jgi:hypothetical protein
MVQYVLEPNSFLCGLTIDAMPHFSLNTCLSRILCICNEMIHNFYSTQPKASIGTKILLYLVNICLIKTGKSSLISKTTFFTMPVSKKELGYMQNNKPEREEIEVMVLENKL